MVIHSSSYCYRSKATREYLIDLLNMVGYYLMNQQKLDDALVVFKVNLIIFLND
jgi:hypothetical protein